MRPKKTPIYSLLHFTFYMFEHIHYFENILVFIYEDQHKTICTVNKNI